MIQKIHLMNYRMFRDFTLELNSGTNILVGANESGKSTLLEAINLAITGRLNGRQLSNELTQHLFNKSARDEYLADLHAKRNPSLPEIVVDLYLDESPETVRLRGSINAKREDSPGLRIAVRFNTDYAAEYAEFIKDTEAIQTIPIEYYKTEWQSFADRSVTTRSSGVTASLIDSSNIKLQSGADLYLQRIIESYMEERERVEVARAFRDLKENFSNNEAITLINQKLNGERGEVSDKTMSISLEGPPRGDWETSVVPLLDELPVHLAGSGEQNSLKILLALNRNVEKAHVVLIEEPENHLSFSGMNKLISKIETKCKGKQVIVTTHSSFVLNKLGLANLIFMGTKSASRISDLPNDTQLFFKKLPGFDTLRFVLAGAVILVEGPSDELVVQRAYTALHKVSPIDNGVDILSVGNTFVRFLEIAKSLSKPVVVVIDNDGNPQAVETKFADFRCQNFIRICFSDDANLRTLEPQLLAANSIKLFNDVFGTSFSNDLDMIDYMSKNKTECALKLFETGSEVCFPEYICNAIQ